ncbi:hypothetical protein LY76DRAFT_208677 [Colletotrichum caudatum]|nr:hypothetical protein LY76DRAFT_208677 [Colletotrichum caudatum]
MLLNPSQWTWITQVAQAGRQAGLYHLTGSPGRLPIGWLPGKQASLVNTRHPLHSPHFQTPVQSKSILLGQASIVQMESIHLVQVCTMDKEGPASLTHSRHVMFYHLAPRLADVGPIAVTRCPGCFFPLGLWLRRGTDLPGFSRCRYLSARSQLAGGTFLPCREKSILCKLGLFVVQGSSPLPCRMGSGLFDYTPPLSPPTPLEFPRRLFLFYKRTNAEPWH